MKTNKKATQVVFFVDGCTMILGVQMSHFNYLVLSVIKYPGMCGPKVNGVVLLTTSPDDAICGAQDFFKINNGVDIRPFEIEEVSVHRLILGRDYSPEASYHKNGSAGETVVCVMTPYSNEEGFKCQFYHNFEKEWQPELVP